MANFNTSSQTKSFLEGPILRPLLIFAIPLVLANILQAGYQMTDSFWVGRIGAAAVAAVSVSTPVTFLLIALGTGLAIAGSTLIAQYAGAGNRSMVSHVAAQTILMVVVVSAVLGTLGYFFAPALLHLMGVAPDVYPGALGFMRVSFTALIFNFTFFVFQAIMRGIGNATLPIYIVLGTVLLNFALDPLFIFGWGPIPGFGVMGAALATLGTQSIAAIVGIVILRIGKNGIYVQQKDFKPDMAYIKRAFFLGFPASIEQSMRALGLTVMTFLIASFGTLAIAAFGIGSTILQVVMIPALGISMAVSVLAGQNIGANKMDRADRIGKLGAWLSFGILTSLGVVVFLFAPSIISFFVPSSPDVVAEGGIFLRIMALSWGFMGVQFGLTGILRASGNMTTAMLLTLISQWVLQFPLAYVLSKHTALGIAGLWWAFPISNIIIALVTICIYAKGNWKKKRIIESEDTVEKKVSEEIFIEEGVR